MSGLRWVSSEAAIGAPVIAGAAVLGFVASWAFGEYVFDPKFGDDMKVWFKSR